MAKIRFSGISQININPLRELFSYIQDSKKSGIIKEEPIKQIIKGRYHTHFWWPSEKELAEWLKKWDATPPDKRYNDKSLKRPWNFEGWIEALEDAEIKYVELNINSNGIGELIFEQISWPSGGIEATEQIIKIFDGVIEENDAI